MNSEVFRSSIGLQVCPLWARISDLLGCVVLLSILTGCSAMGVVATNDPYKKLGQAEQMKRSGRIAIAQRLLLQAIEIFESGEDYPGLAEAYRRYGFHLRVYGEETVYDLDPSRRSFEPTNEDGRMDKAIGYFQKSLEVAEEHDLYDLVTNLHYVIGMTHHYAERPKEGCQAFDRSQAAYERAAKIHPDKEVDLPAGVGSFSELIDRVKRDQKCL